MIAKVLACSSSQVDAIESAITSTLVAPAQAGAQRL